MTRYIRKAPSPGYILFTDTFTGQRTQFKLVEYTVGGAVLTFGAGTADGKEDTNAKENTGKEDGNISKGIFLRRLHIRRRR